MTCTYCHKQVETETYGWGFDEDSHVFHMECYEVEEEVVV